MNERLNMIVLTRPVIILGRNRILMKYQIKIIQTIRKLCLMLPTCKKHISRNVLWASV